LDDEAAYPYYELAASLDLPVLFHTGVHGWLLENYEPILLDRVAQQFPHLKIIVEHMGGWEFFGQALAVVRNNDNCYAGITSTLAEDWAWYLPPEWLRYMTLMIGADRVIFGTDYPFRRPEDIGKDIEAVRAIFHGPQEAERILGGNIATLIGCDED
jgi:predicted TIM-barrel fold metal-dependent hydrolase